MTIFIVVPCFNEQLRLNQNAFVDFAKENRAIHFLFVDDGSEDQTKEMLEGLSKRDENFSVLFLNNNVGKANAVRAAMLQIDSSRVDFLGYWDADLATPLSEIPHFVEKIKKCPEVDIFLGSRICRLGTQIKRKWYRHYIGRIFATLASLSLQLAVYDTQCGAKIFRAEVVEDLFGGPFYSKWLFDIEILFRYIAKYGKATEKLYEVSLYSWKDVGGSKLKLADFVLAPLELIKLNWRYKWRL